MTNILITGSISFSNKGTLAILISTIENILKIAPDSNISVELFFPERQKRIYNFTEDIKVVPVFLINPMKNIYNLLKSDVIIDISAEAFVSYYDDDKLQKFQRFVIHLIPLIFAVIFRKKYIIFLQTLGPFGEYKRIMKYLLNHSDLITLRDENSFRYIKEIVHNKKKIYVSADPAFLLKPSKDEVINGVLSRENVDLGKIKVNSKYIIGISAARTTGRRLSDIEYSQMINKFSDLINQLIKKYNCYILFIPHSSGKINKFSDDVLVGKDIMIKIDQKHRFKIIKGDYSPQDLKGLIAKCDFFISHRMHPAIAAITTNVPVILLAFNDKAYGLMKKFKMERYVCHINEFNPKIIINLLDDLIENRDEIKKIFSTKNKEIKDIVKLSFRKVILVVNE